MLMLITLDAYAFVFHAFADDAADYKIFFMLLRYFALIMPLRCFFLHLLSFIIAAILHCHAFLRYYDA